MKKRRRLSRPSMRSLQTNLLLMRRWSRHREAGAGFAVVADEAPTSGHSRRRKLPDRASMMKNFKVEAGHQLVQPMRFRSRSAAKVQIELIAEIATAIGRTVPGINGSIIPRMDASTRRNPAVGRAASVRTDAERLAGWMAVDTFIAKAWLSGERVNTIATKSSPMSRCGVGVDTPSTNLTVLEQFIALARPPC